MLGFVGGAGLTGAGKHGKSAVSSSRRRVTMQATTEVKPTMWGDGTDGSRCPPADTELVKKYGNLRGVKVPTVTDSMQKFNDAFNRPVPSVYRGIVNEMITLTHLTTVCAMWRYDAVYAFGYDELFNRFLSYYPNMEEREILISCITGAFEALDLDKIRADAKAVREYLIGKNEDDLLKALEEGSEEGPFLSALQSVKKAGTYDWYYSRSFGFGLIFAIQDLGGSLGDDNADRWAKAINVSEVKIKDEIALYLSASERLKQAEQMFADLAAREKKKIAERLSDAAAAAKADATEEEETKTEETSS